MHYTRTHIYDASADDIVEVEVEFEHQRAEPAVGIMFAQAIPHRVVFEDGTTLDVDELGDGDREAVMVACDDAMKEPW